MNSQIQSPLRDTHLCDPSTCSRPKWRRSSASRISRRQLRYRVAEPRRWVGSVRRVLSARAIQGSNSIEGYDVSLEDALAAVEGSEPAEADERDWLAVLGYRRAMTYVLQLADDPHFEYSSALIRSLHFMVTEYSLEASPGLWRPGPIWVQNSVTGEIVYEAPESDAVPELIEALISQLRSDDDVPAMVRAAMAHLNLVMIHPFRDGNGRMARCLQTLALARDRILSPEWMSIEEYLGAHTQAYYDILAEVGRGAWNPRLDARPWVRFCLKAHYIQAANVLTRIRESERLWIAIDELREKHELPREGRAGQSLRCGNWTADSESRPRPRRPRRRARRCIPRCWWRPWTARAKAILRSEPSQRRGSATRCGVRGGARDQVEGRSRSSCRSSGAWKTMIFTKYQTMTFCKYH